MVKQRLLDHLVWRVLNLPVTRLSNCVVSANVHAADDRLKTTGEARLPLTFVKNATETFSKPSIIRLYWWNRIFSYSGSKTSHCSFITAPRLLVFVPRGRGVLTGRRINGHRTTGF